MQKKEVIRMCIACHEHKLKAELIRVVRNKDGEFFVDKTGKMAGRGAYICDNIKCFETAYKKKGLERAFKMQIPQTVYEMLKGEFGDE